MQAAMLNLLRVLVFGLVLENAKAESTDRGESAPYLETESYGAINEILVPLVEDQLVSGVHLSIFKSREKVFELNFGFADDVNKIKPSSNVLYAIASMSKPIVSLATLMLVDQGKLSLDDPVKKFIPAFHDLLVVEDGDYDNPAEPLDRDMTIHDLLTHTSGLTYSEDITGREEMAQLYAQLNIFSIDGLFQSELGDLNGHIAALSELPLVAQPGTQFLYSVSTDVLGKVLEVVSGQPLDKLLQRLIFEPLDMSDTAFRVPDVAVDRLSQLYSPRVATYPIPGVYKRYQVYPNLPKGQKNFGQSEKTYLSGGAGVISTARDYGRFLDYLAHGNVTGQGTLLEPEILDLMFTNQLPEALGSGGLVYNFGPSADNTAFTYGLGIRLIEGGDPNKREDHDYYFWAGAANTGFWIDPTHDLIGVLMVQHLPTQYDRISELVEASRSIFTN